MEKENKLEFLEFEIGGNGKGYKTIYVKVENDNILVCAKNGHRSANIDNLEYIMYNKEKSMEWLDKFNKLHTNRWLARYDKDISSNDETSWALV